MGPKVRARAKKGSLSGSAFEKEVKRHSEGVIEERDARLVKRKQTTTPMTKERRYEIAFEVVRYKLRQDGITLSLGNMEKFEVAARANHLNGVLVKELREFVRFLTQEFVDDLLPPQ
ncbi:MAG: hypothetical protein V1704_01620 [Candidatus Vogelbacteria bacterium]